MNSYDRFDLKLQAYHMMEEMCKEAARNKNQCNDYYDNYNKENKKAKENEEELVLGKY